MAKREFKKTFSVTEFFRLILLGKKKEISIRDLKESQIFHTMQQHRQGIDQVGLLLMKKSKVFSTLVLLSLVGLSVKFGNARPA